MKGGKIPAVILTFFQLTSKLIQTYRRGIETGVTASMVR